MKKRLIWMFLLVGTVSISFTSPFFGKIDPDQRKILSLAGSAIEQMHYLKPVIDDQFSSGVWNAYIESLDPQHTVFLKTDLELLKKYKYQLDNEIHEEPILFLPEISAIYRKRCEQAREICTRLLSAPFSFKATDSIGNAAPVFPETERERSNRWSDLLRYRVLEQMNTLQYNQVSGKKQTAVAIEKLAREQVLKQQERVFQRIAKYGDDRFFNNYVNTIFRYTDPHSDYFPPLMKQMFDQAMSNRFFGIGAGLKETDGNITITSLDAGSPALKSGLLMVNDQIVAVAQAEGNKPVEVTGMELQDVVGLIRGEKGSLVRLTCRKQDGRQIVVPLIRDEIKPADAAAKSSVIIKNGIKVGYINLPLFYDDFEHKDGAHAADDVEKEVRKLKQENVSSMIIDLRNNGGGSLNQVVKMVGLFVGKGAVVQVRSSGDRIQVLENPTQDAIFTGPLLVMVNEQSASASEIFAAAIQDYKRGLVVGTNTFGKGTVQQSFPLGAQSLGGAKLTIQKFYRINGSSTQMKGVIPDVMIPSAFEGLSDREGNLPFVLDWDRINPAPYSTMDNHAALTEKVIAGAKVRLAADAAFVKLKAYNSWLVDYNESKNKRNTVGSIQNNLKKFSTIGQAENKLLPKDLILDQAVQISTDLL